MAGTIRIHTAVVLPLAVGVVVIVGPWAGCSSSDAVNPVDSGTTDAPLGPDAPEAADAASDGDADTLPWCWNDPPPAGVPPGWIRWNEFDPCCGLYVPTAQGALPPPIAWATCDAVEQPAGVVCRQMVINWDARQTGVPWIPFGDRALGWVHHDQTVTLMFARAVKAGKLGWLILIADADGPVRQAVLETDSIAGCSVGPGDLGERRYALGMTLGGKGAGACAGNIDDFPMAPVLHSPKQVMALLVSDQGALDVNTMLLHDWANPSSTTFIGQKDGMFTDGFTASGDGIFWNASAGCVSRLVVWTPNSGPKDFITYGSDATQGVADIGTDGKDLVWMYGSGGCSTQTLLYQSASIMTAPSTTDPALLQPRRLRSEVPNGLGVSPFIVGCGYAARETWQGIRLVRLSDGVSWLLDQQTSAVWKWEVPIALTCQELFAQVSVRADGGVPETSYARVRLDSLGPGTPPD